jgi:hypothetical protein
MRTFLWMDLWKQCFKSETEGIHSEECPVFWLEHSQRMLFWNQYHISGTTGSTQRSDPVPVTTQKPCKKPKLRGFTQRSAPFQSRRSLECVHGAVNTAQHCRDSLRKVPPFPLSAERKLARNKQVWSAKNSVDTHDRKMSYEHLRSSSG